MRRREFIERLGSAAVLPVAAWYLLKETHAQQSDRVRSLSIEILSLKAETSAATIRQFFKEIENQVGWTTQLPWSTGTIDQRKFDGSRVLRQVPAISELAQLDSAGKERLRQSKLGMDVIGSDIDFSHEAKFAEAMAYKVYYGPVYFRRTSEPYMTLALAGTRRDAGVSVAEVNLKLVWDLVMQMKGGEHASRISSMPRVASSYIPTARFKAIFRVSLKCRQCCRAFALSGSRSPATSVAARC